ncbi:MAG: hypothetical protein IIC40_01545 [Candidatus Marinimicrobia bacterium]|nr:hypothetical protein [Candidatus Neomarinimicrobiota bacterium]
MNPNSRLFRTMLLLVLMNGCLIESPESPTWEVNLAIPLIDEKYPLSDLVGPIAGDSSNGFIDLDSLDILRLNVRDTIGTIELDESRLTVRGIGLISVSEVIGPLTLNNLGDDQVFESQTLSSMSEAVAAAPNGTSVPVPGFSLSPIDNDVAITDVEEATIEQGIIRISIYNGFIDAPNSGIPLTNMQIVLTDVNNTVIGTALYDRIGPDSTETRDIDLAGKSFVVPLTTTTTGESPGTSNFEINSASKAGKIRVTVQFIGPFIASRVKGNIPSTNIKISESIPLAISGSTELISGRFSSETDEMILTINNGLQVPLSASLLLPNFIDFTTNLAETVIWDSIPPGGSETQRVDLRGDSLTNPAGEFPLTNIEYIFEATTLSPGSSSIISEDDAVELAIVLDTLRFLRWKANFDETIPTTETNIKDMPEGFAGISLEDVRLILNLHNTISVPMFLDLNIMGTNTILNSRAELALVDAELRSPPLFSLQPETTQIVFKKDSTCVNAVCEPSGETDIVDFFNILPDNISISGEASLLGVGVVSVGQSMSGDYQLIVPFSFSLDSIAKFVPSTFSTIAALEDKQKEQIENNILYAIVESELVNSFPFGGTVSLLITDDLTKFDVHPDSLDVDTLLTFVLPDTDPDMGIFTAIKRDSVFLDSSIIRIFTRGEEHYLKPLIELKSTDGKPRTVTASNFIRIKSVMTFRIKINPR